MAPTSLALSCRWRSRPQHQKRHFALRQCVIRAPQKETSGWSLMGQGVIPSRAQRDHRKRRDHQQLIIVDVSNDLRLLRDHGVELGAPGGGRGIPELS
jgi:hypothetical protein